MPDHFELQGQNDVLKLVDQLGELSMYVALDDTGFELLVRPEEFGQAHILWFPNDMGQAAFTNALQVIFGVRVRRHFKRMIG